MDLTYTVELPEYLVHCPVYWKNFVNTCLDGATVEQELKKYNGRIIQVNPDTDQEVCWVEFGSEADYMWFKLKWL